MSTVIQDVISIPPNTVNDDVLSGKRLAQMGPFEAGVATVLASGAAAGMKITVSVGRQTYMERSELNSTNRIPVDPDDQVASGIEILPTERLTLTIENTTAGALNFFYRVVIFDAVVDN